MQFSVEQFDPMSIPVWKVIIPIFEESDEIFSGIFFFK